MVEIANRKPKLMKGLNYILGGQQDTKIYQRYILLRLPMKLIDLFFV
jgi:hypothetical protein